MDPRSGVREELRHRRCDEREEEEEQEQEQEQEQEEEEQQQQQQRRPVERERPVEKQLCASGAGYRQLESHP